jgi:hypothetical protein
MLKFYNNVTFIVIRLRDQSLVLSYIRIKTNTKKIEIMTAQS